MVKIYRNSLIVSNDVYGALAVEEHPAGGGVGG